jgi:hypothetical protein
MNLDELAAQMDEAEQWANACDGRQWNPQKLAVTLGVEVSAALHMSFNDPHSVLLLVKDVRELVAEVRRLREANSEYDSLVTPTYSKRLEDRPQMERNARALRLRQRGLRNG